MAQTRRKTEYREGARRSGSERYYAEGNAARKYYADAEPDYEEKRRKKTGKKVQKKTKTKTYHRSAVVAQKSLSFDAGYTVLVAIALIATAFSLVWMVSMQGKVEAQQINVASLQSELLEKQADNAAFQDNLNNMYSLEEIYKIATSELGMVYSEQGQVIYYNSANEDYVNQYDDVPEAR